ncbi:MAG TPA: PIG-L deacetylase family protein [Vicinamibacteria bacterium]|jgi:LmbE family N-acetylglucosaminyl deacetylase
MNVLAIAAHPDDETLGCGGSLLKHRDAGDRIFWLIATACYEPRWSAAVIERKAMEVERVAKAYDIQKTFRLGLPNARLDTVAVDDLMGPISRVIDEVAPEIVYLLHAGDVHTDHQAVFTASMSVLKPFHMARLRVRRILSYETLSSTDAAPPRWAFVPNVYSDITPYMDRKLEIMAMYETEVQEDPMPRSASALRAVARYRGSAVNAGYAEAFTLLRELW